MLAPHLESQIVEVFIVPEIKSMSIEESEEVRRNVAANLMNVCEKVSKEVFSRELLPVLQRLSLDNYDSVRVSILE